MPTPDEHAGTSPDLLPDGEIELEPTTLEFERPLSQDSTADGIAAGHLSTSVSDELTALLRSRLRAAASFVAAAYLACLVFSLANPDSVYRMDGPSLALRGLLAIAVCGLLAGRLALTYRQLRILEYLFFATETLLLLAAQYSINIQLVERGDLLSMTAFEKNGVMRIIILMMIYGVFIPNDPKITARVVLTMAVGPIVVVALVLQHAIEDTATVSALASDQNAASNALFVLIGAGLAIFAGRMLNGLRRELHAARRLGQYRLLEKLGAGGMGDVYLAEHQLLKRPCALKLIRPDLADVSTALARFEREVQSAAMLSHPNTIEIFDYGRADDGTFYYVMEYLPGLSVADLVRQAGLLPPGRAVYIMRQVCGSLAEAHRMGLVHRDLKPANILVAIMGGQCDVAKVLDFGLVKVPQADDGLRLTAEYTVSGTPSFMSPEQAKGADDIDGRTDLYALGAVLYFMLTGKPPFERANPVSLMIAHASEPVQPPSQINPGAPADLEAVVLRCLAKEPADRYADARALAAALEACDCAADWNQSRAEVWWLSHAGANPPETHTPQLTST